MLDGISLQELGDCSVSAITVVLKRSCCMETGIAIHFPRTIMDESFDRM